MMHIKKVEIDPQFGEGGSQSRAIKKIVNLVKILGKLALQKGFDEKLRILGADGKFKDNTNIAHLLQYAMTPGKVIDGQEDFIALLQKADIPSDYFVNENIKHKLDNRHFSSKDYSEAPQVFVESSTPVKSPETEPEEIIQDEEVNESQKRKRESDEESDFDEFSPKRKNTMLNNSESIKRNISEVNELDDEPEKPSFKRARRQIPQNWIIPKDE